MSRKNYDFTSESVSEGHPDKVSDRISDEIVDLYFRKSVAAGMSPWDVRVAAETLTTTNKVVIAGETRGKLKPWPAPRLKISAMSNPAFTMPMPILMFCFTHNP